MEKWYEAINKANEYYSQGDYITAIDRYAAVIEDMTPHLEEIMQNDVRLIFGAYKNYASACEMLDRMDEALEMYGKCKNILLGRGPDDIWHDEQGIFYKKQLPWHDDISHELEAILNRIINIWFYREKLHQPLYDCILLLNILEEREEDGKQVSKNDLVIAAVNVAVSEDTIGDHADAAAHWQKAITYCKEGMPSGETSQSTVVYLENMLAASGEKTST